MSLATGYNLVMYHQNKPSSSHIFTRECTHKDIMFEAFSWCRVLDWLTLNRRLKVLQQYFRVIFRLGHDLSIPCAALAHTLIYRPYQHTSSAAFLDCSIDSANGNAIISLFSSSMSIIVWPFNTRIKQSNTLCKLKVQLGLTSREAKDGTCHSIVREKRKEDTIVGWNRRTQSGSWQWTSAVS